MMKFDDKEYFFSNANSWIEKPINTPSLYIEYICLVDKKDIDTIIITYNNHEYIIYCDPKNLVYKNNALYLNIYLDLTYNNFIKDDIDGDSYSDINPICIESSNIVPPQAVKCDIFNDTIIFNNWNNDKSLLFYSKSDCGRHHACVIVYQKVSIFTICMQYEYMLHPLLYYSISDHDCVFNELKQIDCSSIKYNFDKLHIKDKPLFVPIDSKFHLVNVDSALKIKYNDY